MIANKPIVTAAAGMEAMRNRPGSDWIGNRERHSSPKDSAVPVLEFKLADISLPPFLLLYIITIP